MNYESQVKTLEEATLASIKLKRKKTKLRPEAQFTGEVTSPKVPKKNNNAKEAVKAKQQKHTKRKKEQQRRKCRKDKKEENHQPPDIKKTEKD